MRILFLGASLIAGGAERQWERLITGLDRGGHDVRVVALDGGGPVAEALSQAGIPVTVGDVRHRLDLPRLTSIPDFRHFQADVIVSKDTSATCVAAALSRLRRVPHVHTDHRQVGLRENSRREALIRVVAPFIDRVVLVSPRQAGMWEAMRVPSSRLQVIRNGVDAPTPADRAALRADLDLGDDAVVAMMTATLRPEKRVGDFIDAVRMARRDDPRIVGVVAGGGEQLAFARDRVGDDSGFRLLGHRDDVSVLLQAADVFVLASEIEAQPLAILEAMASGLPLVVTDVGDIPDLATEANGRRVAVGDIGELAARICEFADQPALRRTCGDESRRLWEREWRADAMVSHYEQMFSGLSGSAAR